MSMKPYHSRCFARVAYAVKILHIWTALTRLIFTPMINDAYHWTRIEEICLMVPITLAYV